MTAKQKILEVVKDLPDDTPFEAVIDRLYLLRKIEIGIAQADAGDVISHDEFMKELFGDDEG